MERKVIRNNVIPLEIVQKNEGIHKDDFWSYILSLHAIQRWPGSMKIVAAYEGELRRMGWVNVSDYGDEMGRGVPRLVDFGETGEAMIVMLRSAVRSLDQNTSQNSACQIHNPREHVSVTYVLTNCETGYPRSPHPNDAVFVRWENPGPEDMLFAMGQHLYAQSVYGVSNTVWGRDENIRHIRLGLPRYWNPSNGEDDLR